MLIAGRDGVGMRAKNRDRARILGDHHQSPLLIGDFSGRVPVLSHFSVGENESKFDYLFSI
jgi:hypothetical protein